MEAGFYSNVVESLPLDPAAQVRFPPRAVGIFLHPVTKLFADVQCIDYLWCADSCFLIHGMNWMIYSALEYYEMLKFLFCYHFFIYLLQKLSL